MKILLFGHLAKNLGWKEKKINWEKNKTLKKIWDEEIKLKKEKIKPALNFEFCEWDPEIPKNAEIAFLPPMSGG